MLVEKDLMVHDSKIITDMKLRELSELKDGQTFEVYPSREKGRVINSKYTEKGTKRKGVLYSIDSHKQLYVLPESITFKVKIS